MAIGGKLVQNNAIELCAPDRCCDTWDSPSGPSLSAGIAWRGLQLWCAGYFGQGCTPRERACCYCKLSDRGQTGSPRAPCTMQKSCLHHRPSPVAPSGGPIAVGQRGNLSAFQPQRNQGCAKTNSPPRYHLQRFASSSPPLGAARTLSAALSSSQPARETRRLRGLSARRPRHRDVRSVCPPCSLRQW